MTHQQLQKQIVSCLWSNSLKEYIETNGCSFTDEQLLGIAFHFSADFEQRISLMQLLAEYSDTVSGRAKKCIEWQNNCLETFCKDNDGCVFVLYVKDNADAAEANIICNSFSAAMNMIDRYYLYYDFISRDDTAQYRIEKKIVFKSDQPLCNDVVGECLVSADKKIIRVDMYNDTKDSGECCHTCITCQNPCVEDIQVQFPSFVPHLSPVKYMYCNKIHYGVHLNFWKADKMDVCYIIPFDDEMMKNMQYDENWEYHSHEHIACPYVEIVTVGELSTQYAQRYHSFVKWFDSEHNK